MRRTLVIATLLVAVAAGVVWFTQAQPTPSVPAVPPEEVARRWAQVERWAQTERPLGLAPLAQVVPRGGPAIPIALEPAARWVGTPPQVAEALPSDIAQQIDGLLAWGAAPTYAGLCGGGEVDLVAVVDRLRVALAAADATQVDRAKAVLQTGRALGARGGWLHAAMALAVVESTAQWAAARGVPAWPALRAAVPTPRDFARAAAQEALCAADLVRSLPKAEQASLAAGVARSRVIAHEQVGRLQGVDTFEALRAATEPGPEGTQPEEILGHTLMVNQAAHLARFERTARKVTALLAQTPTGG